MKIRKALAVVLSLAMTVTLMPATAFASSAKVANVATVKDGATANALVRVTLDDALLAGSYAQATGWSNSQTVTLEVAQNGEFKKVEGSDDSTIAGKAGVVKYTAGANDGDPNVYTAPAPVNVKTGASVVIDAYDADGVEVPTYSYTGKLETISAEEGEANNPYKKGGLFVTATDCRDKSMDITLTYIKGTATTGAYDEETLKKDTVLYFYVNVEADGSDGDEVQVALDGDGASVIDSFSAKTIATISGDGTTATVEDADTVGRGTNIKAAEVTIKEVTGTSVGAGQEKVVLTLPKGVTWGTEMTKNSFSGSMVKSVEYVGGQDTRYLTVIFTANNNTDVKEKLVFTPYINVTKDASKGNIKLKIEGEDQTENAQATVEAFRPAIDTDISDASDLVIAVYGDANVNILCKDADKLPEVVAGKLVDKDGDDFVVSITFEENAKDALTSGKYIDLAFNTDQVQVKVGSDINAYVGDKYAKKEYSDGSSAEAANDVVLVTDLDATKKDDRSEFTITIPEDDKTVGKGTWKKGEANTLTLFIPVTVSADYVGDISLTAKGNAGIDETTVVVGKSVAPVTVETTVTKVVNGAQAQATADVKITENFPGALKDKGAVTLEVDDLTLGGVVFKGDGKAAVTAGDIEIKDPKKTDNTVSFTIDDESTEASTIVISDLAVNLGRTLPEGEYNLKVKGSALVENNDYNDGDFSKNAVKASYINITTAADTAQTGTVANFFLDGSKNSTYTVNGVDATMDAAAYLDSNNRTMVPIRYVAYALGLADTDISYNVGDSTATLSGLTNVVKVTTGSNVLQASNGNVVMDTVAVNNSGRLYVPARFIAQAMGAEVAWDQATKTVTITK